MPPATSSPGFAHLQPGSVSVAAGQRVRAGDLLGRVGHTGNSTSPHLHFQLMDSADLLQAHGIACAFTAYEVRARRIVGAGDGCDPGQYGPHPFAARSLKPPLR